MSTDAKFHQQRARAIRQAIGNAQRPEPENKPEVPAYAVRALLVNHVRYQFHPLLLNAIGGPLIDGPKELIGVEIRCPVCKHIQAIGQPGVEHHCGETGLGVYRTRGCDLRYKFTSLNPTSWLWHWRAPKPEDSLKVPVDGPKILLPGPASQSSGK